MSKWVLQKKKSECRTLPPIVTRILANRGITTDAEAESYFNGDLRQMHEPDSLKDIDRGAGLVRKAIHEQWSIRILGDYDVDGVCATAILYRGLEAVGAKVSVAIPHRVRDGYGLSERLIREASKDGVQLIITCDNGISALERVELAKSLGMDVLITDHHEVPYEVGDDGERKYLLPDAYAIIDPKQEDCQYPFRDICGALVAYKFVQYITRTCPIKERLNEELLQLAALATVCDIMDLRDENRVLVKHGLEGMTKEPCQGIKQLISVQGLEDKAITAYHLGFIIGPCINAAGRLDSAERALFLLLSKNGAEALKIAGDLKELNAARIAMTEESVKVGKELLSPHKVQVLYLPECHESIAGIVAGRLKDASHKPVLVATRTTGRNCKGSGRSIEAYPLYHEMAKVQDLFQSFGGHALAAGFSMELDKLDELRERLNANCPLTEEDISGTLYVDALLRPSEVNGDFVNTIELMEPFGAGNRKPLFLCPSLRLLRLQKMGRTGAAGRLTVMDGEGTVELVLFKGLEELVQRITSKHRDTTFDSLLDGCQLTEEVRLSVVYSVGWNEYKGSRSIQRTVEDFEVL